MSDSPSARFARARVAAAASARADPAYAAAASALAATASALEATAVMCACRAAITCVIAVKRDAATLRGPLAAAATHVPAPAAWKLVKAFVDAPLSAPGPGGVA